MIDVPLPATLDDIDRLWLNEYARAFGRLALQVRLRHPEPARWDIAPGTQAYLSPYWVEVVSYSPKRKMVRYRRISRGKAPIERMGRKAFAKVARLG